MFRPHTLYIRIRIVRKVSEPAFAMKDQDVTDVIRRKQQTAMRYIGIDVSKATFVVAYSSDKGGEIRTFNNTTTGIKQFIGALPKDSSIHCVMEATGNYSAMLLYLLNVAGIAVSMENPLKIKNFARAMLSTVKTDKIDARLIALYGEKMNPQPFKIQGEAIQRLRQKRTVIRQLTKQITAMSNLRGSLACMPVPDKGATHTVDETIEFLEKRRDRLQSELTDLVEVEFSRQLALLTTIKGIGITLATALIITTGGFTYFQNAKQVSRYLGICPTYEQSGTSVNIRGHINRNGDAYTRGLLYVAAWTASRFNTKCGETYTRLRQNGKPGKLAMIAVANKLVRQAFAVVTHDKEYVDGFVSNRP